jgi:large subunit ribosomal protein L30
MTMLKITLTKGLVGKTDTQRKVVAALGLGKFGSSVEHLDSPTIRGMIRKVSHLVAVVPSTSDGKEKAAKNEKLKVKMAAIKLKSEAK